MKLYGSIKHIHVAPLKKWIIAKVFTILIKQDEVVDKSREMFKVMYNTHY